MRLWLLLGMTLVLSAVGCRCRDEAEVQPRRSSSTIPPRPDHESGSGRRGEPSVSRLEARFLVTPSLELGERLKCARLRLRLERAHAVVRLPKELRLPVLSKETALISFVLVRDELFRFVRWQGRTRRLETLARRRVDRLLIALRDTLEFGALDMSDLTPLLRRAYTLLLADALPRQVRHVIIAPDGLTRFVPLHAFLAPTSQGKLEFLISRVDVAYAPCISFVRRAPDRHGVTLVVPSYGARGDRRPIAGAAEEARAIAASLRTRGVSRGVAVGKASLLLGDAATPERLLDALAAPGDVVHFAGHGLVDLRLGNPPELIFPDIDPGLSVRRLTQRHVRAGLVVLASCMTAYVARFRNGPPRLAEVNLAEALLAGGAHGVVAASWGVKDRQSSAQMRVFYRNLEARGPAEALALAQRDRIARLRPPHPRYWAFYALYGASGW